MKIPGRNTLVKLIIPALLIYAVFMIADAAEKQAKGRELVSSLQQQAEEIRRENEALREEIASAGDDEVIAAVARKRFGLVMPDEKVFYDPPDRGTAR